MVTGCTSSSQNDGTELLSVVAISRHGIRSQTASVEQHEPVYLAATGFSAVATPRGCTRQSLHLGQRNVTRLGAWYRDFYTAQGLLPPRGSCPAAGAVFVYADVDERTIQTAQGYLDGLFQSEATPDCGVKVISSSKRVDPYIRHVRKAGKCQIDTAADLARV